MTTLHIGDRLDTRKVSSLFCGISIALGIASASWGQQPVGVVPPGSVATQDDAVDIEGQAVGPIEILQRGQLHEAFAEVYQQNPEPGVLAPREPPHDVDEIPPEYRPAGENVQWIPGYWAWDDEQQAFFWVTGLWRDVPPGNAWVPGYWNMVEDGYRWVSGFWSDAEHEVEYLPAPPTSIENGPSTPAPELDTYFYIPGCWIYKQTNYVWRPGYWRPRIDNRIWIPSQYIWTPHGCVFRRGYWDYVIAARGVVFAPIRYRQPIYLSAGYSFTPSYCLSTNYNFFVHLFIRRNCRQYYFGNWYGYQQCQPWIRAHRHRNFYDPLLSYYASSRFRYANQPLTNWISGRYGYYASNPRNRPAVAVNFDDRNRVGRGRAAGRGQDVKLAARYDARFRNSYSAHRRATSNDRGRGDGFVRLDKESRRDFRQRSVSIAQLKDERRRVERDKVVRSGATDRSGFKIPHQRPTRSDTRVADGRAPRPIADREDRRAEPGNRDQRTELRLRPLSNESRRVPSTNRAPRAPAERKADRAPNQNPPTVRQFNPERQQIRPQSNQRDNSPRNEQLGQRLLEEQRRRGAGASMERAPQRDQQRQVRQQRTTQPRAQRERPPQSRTQQSPTQQPPRLAQPHTPQPRSLQQDANRNLRPNPAPQASPSRQVDQMRQRQVPLQRAQQQRGAQQQRRSIGPGNSPNRVDQPRDLLQRSRQPPRTSRGSPGNLSGGAKQSRGQGKSERDNRNRRSPSDPR